MGADGASEIGTLANDKLVPERINHEALSVLPSKSRKHNSEFPILADLLSHYRNLLFLKLKLAGPSRIEIAMAVFANQSSDQQRSG